ncbi:acyl-CoA thioesterase [Pseudonocardia adelaidensis]|uniref:Acyl-CoA thioester hydrolase n=1 Tax=Pseudonocardia adelaidensis TaxID=648754 RepID=A0ABP9NZM0_9PSEU
MRELSFRLSYGDCDAVGIAYFAIYYRWMERAYSGWLYDHGLRSGELQESLGVLTVGVHSECTYQRMVRVFDELTIRLVLDRIGTTSYTVGFDFVRDGEVVTHGAMTFGCRDPESGGKAGIPERLLTVLRTLPEQARA